MESRLGKLAGVAAFALMLVRLGRLLERGQDVPNWPLILVASAILGGVVWWLLTQVTGNRRKALAVFLPAGLLLFLRISVPQSLIVGVLPSLDTVGTLFGEVEIAFRLIRFGVAPIVPTPGVIAILATLMWAVGAMYASGVVADRTALTALPSIVGYLQFAIFDRVPASMGWMTASASVLALTVTADVAQVQRMFDQY